MHLWLLLAGAFLLQEFATTIAILTTAYHEHFPVWTIHALWFFIVVPHVALIRLIGAWFRRRFSHTTPGRWMHAFTERFRNAAGIYGEEFTVFALALLFSPALASLMAAFLELPLLTSVLLVVIADFLWYLFVWAVVLGIASVTDSLPIAIGASLIIGVGLFFLIRSVRRRMLPRV